MIRVLPTCPWEDGSKPRVCGDDPWLGMSLIIGAE